MKTLLRAIAVASLLFCAQTAYSDTLDVTGLTLMAVVQTRGEYDNYGLSYWNGAPLSPTNQPTYEQDQLSATLSFYVDNVNKNELFLTVSNVFDTQYDYVYGEVFNYIALTGIDFSLGFPRASSPLTPQFSNDWALGGEALLGPVAGQSAPLSDTPGWTFAGVSGSSQNPDYSIGTSSVNNALTHFSSVSGTTRIYGGAAFEFAFDPGVNLFNSADFLELSADAEFGFGRYIGPGNIIAVPEPPIWTLTLIGFLVLANAKARRGRDTTTNVRASQ